MKTLQEISLEDEITNLTSIALRKTGTQKQSYFYQISILQNTYNNLTGHNYQPRRDIIGTNIAGTEYSQFVKSEQRK